MAAANSRRTLRMTQVDGDSEVAQLERQLRMEAEKKDELGATLRTQTTMIEKLGKDNNQLKEELEVLQREIAATQQAGGDLRILQAKIEYYQSEIESEKERLAELDKLTTEMDHKVQQSRKKVGLAGRADAAAQTVVAAQRQTLENRLQTALKEYNAMLTQNATHRQAIDHLKSERKFFDNISRKLGREIQEMKKQTAEIIEKSTQAYDNRDEAISKMAALKDKTDKELAQYNTEIKELTRVLEHDRKLRSFMSIKGQERKDFGGTTMLAKTRKREELQKEKDGTPEERLASLERLFNEIMAQTGVASLEQAVDRFIQGEAANFSAFQYVTELNSNIEQLQEKIAELQVKADKTTQDFATAQKEREQQIAKLKLDVTANERVVETLESTCENAKQQLDALTGPVAELFQQIGCERGALGDTLGNEHVSRSNLQLYLSVIEQRANELLQLRARLDARSKQKWEEKEAELRDQAPPEEPFDATTTLGPKPVLPSLLGTGPQMLSPPAVVHAPSTDAVSEVDDIEDDAPLSIEELKARLKGGADPNRAGTQPLAKSIKKNASNIRVTKKR